MSPKRVALTDVCDFLDYMRKPITAKDRIAGPYPYYGANGVLDYIDSWIFDEELVLLAEDGGFFDEPERGVAYRISGKTWVNNHAHVLRPKNNINVDYLGYALKQYDVRSIVTGATVKKITQKSAREMKIPLPSLDEQKRIVKILDEADLLRQKRKEAICLLDRYLISKFHEIFGDPVSNPKEFEIVSLGKILKSMTSGSRGWAKYFSDEGDYFLTIKNVGRDNRLRLDNITKINPPVNAEAKRTRVIENDILMSITADLGRTIVVPKLDRNAYINQHLVILRIDDLVDPVYISHYLSTEAGQRQLGALNKGAAKAGLNFDDVRSIKVMLPPFNLQKRYSNIVAITEKLRFQMIKQQDELNNQFNALMQKAFKDK